MAARVARNNGSVTTAAIDWNGNAIPPAAMAVVDDQAPLVRDLVDAGVLELDPTLGRHYEAGPTERRVRPTEGHDTERRGLYPGSTP